MKKLIYENNTLEIRPARIEDAANWTDINLKTWRTTYGKIFDEKVFKSNEKDREARIDRLIDNISKKSNYNIVASVNNKLVGIMSYGKLRPYKELSGNEYAEIYAIYILSEYQGLGIGRKLINWARKDLINNGYSKMIIWVLKENPNIEFYNKIGGKIFDTKTITFFDEIYNVVGCEFNLYT